MTMADAYPYTISNKQIEPFLAQIRAAAKPERLSLSTIRKWGFSASNDRALPRILKDLGFLTEAGAPTELYDRLRDETEWKTVLGDRIKDLYSDLYTINTNIHNATDDEIKGAISRVTGKDSKSVNRFFSTFKALVALASLNGRPVPKHKESATSEPPRVAIVEKPTLSKPEYLQTDTSFHYNIQIHLPATTDISVYNAIFKSLKESLLA